MSNLTSGIYLKTVNIHNFKDGLKRRVVGLNNKCIVVAALFEDFTDIEIKLYFDTIHGKRYIEAVNISNCDMEDVFAWDDHLCEDEVVDGKDITYSKDCPLVLTSNAVVFNVDYGYEDEDDVCLEDISISLKVLDLSGEIKNLV